MCVYIYVCIEGSMRMKEREKRDSAFTGKYYLSNFEWSFFFLYHSANLNINM